MLGSRRVTQTPSHRIGNIFRICYAAFRERKRRLKIDCNTIVIPAYCFQQHLEHIQTIKHRRVESTKYTLGKHCIRTNDPNRFRKNNLPRYPCFHLRIGRWEVNRLRAKNPTPRNFNWRWNTSQKLKFCQKGYRVLILLPWPPPCTSPQCKQTYERSIYYQIGRVRRPCSPQCRNTTPESCRN